MFQKENTEDKREIKSSSDEETSRISSMAPPLLSSTLHTAINQALYYDEVALNCNR